MNSKNLISIRNSVYNAFEDMGKKVMDSDVPVFSRWATYAAKDIGSLGSFKQRIFVIKGNNCVFDLPCCVASVKTVVIGDHGCDCESTIFSSISQSYSAASTATVEQNTAFVVISADTDTPQCGYSAYNWRIQDGSIVFDPGTYSEGYITILAMALEEDDRGFVKASENAIEAITTFILYKYAKRSRFGKQKMDRVDVKDLEDNYCVLRRDARAEDSEPTDSEKLEIASMINNPLMGWGYNVYSGNYMNL